MVSPVTSNDAHRYSEDYKGEANHYENGLEGAVTNEEQLTQGFSTVALLAVSLMLGGAWANLFNTLATTLVFGSSIVLLYGLWVVGVGISMVYISLAEYASAWPTSSGPQEWAFQLFPSRWKRFGSYAVAWTLSLLYLFATIASTIILAKQVVGLAAYRDPTYVPEKVHVWAVNVGIFVMCGLINIFAIKGMNLLQTFNLIFFVCGFFVWLIVPIARTQKYTTAKEVFTGDLNVSGWSNFVAFMIGLAGVSAGYGIPDSVTHIAEETRRPATDLPKIMILTPLIALLTGTAMVLTFLFCGVPSIVMALNQTGVPYLDFLDQTVRNRTGATIMSVILIYIQFVACLQAQLASSRTIFTFAREGGAFLPKLLGAVHPKLQVPVVPVIINVVFGSCITLIMLGSDTALNVFMNCTATLGLLTYVPLFITSMVRGRSFYRGPFHMGKWGWIPNILACVFMSFFIVFWHFPYFKDWTPEMFNYNIAIVPGLLLLGIVAWFVSGRKTYLMFRHIE